MLLPMRNPLQEYAWGSLSFIQTLTGNTELDGKPVAEMWMSAHPKAPSEVLFQGEWVGLDRSIAEHPQTLLGSYANIHGGTLPFLLKVLAAEEPLSIQAHPDLAQAREGFQRENDRGIPLNAPHRNYRDDNHKPELICALTPFTALCGFRPYQQIISNFLALGLDKRLPAFQDFAYQQDEHSWRILFRQIMDAGEELISFAGSRFGAVAGEDGNSLSAALTLCGQLAERYPNDPGSLAPLYLNLITLQPFEALYLDAGVPHAYIYGAGMELMANSDNVLRGGLTPKHIDAQELCAILSYKGSSVNPVQMEVDTTGITRYLSPAREFELGFLAVDGKEIAIPNLVHSPMIAFCLKGETAVEHGGQSIFLGMGNSLFVSADSDIITVSGKGTVFIAACPARVPRL